MSVIITTEVLFHDDIRSLDDRVDLWLRDLVDDTVGYTAGRLREHAPGGIDRLVTEDGGQFDPQLGIIRGMAGVLPDLEEEVEHPRGLGSNPADYPFYVDVGTGIFGEFGRPITAFPGGVMGPIEYQGRMIYPRSIKGQPAQDYSGAAHRDTDLWLAGHIKTSSAKLGNT
jgi:hypothetical protein